MKKMINTIFNAVGMAMGIAVTVLMILQQMPADKAILLLGLGVACLGMGAFTKNEA